MMMYCVQVNNKCSVLFIIWTKYKISLCGKGLGIAYSFNPFPNNKF